MLAVSGKCIQVQYGDKRIGIFEYIKVKSVCMAKEPIKITNTFQNEKKDVCTRFKRGGIYNMQNLNTVKNKSNNLR